MGSFSEYCQISQITITSGTPCYLVPLQKKPMSEGRPWSLYCLPILGEYNSYGTIENIELDKNTTCVEQLTNLSIEQFCDLLTDFRSILDLSYCFIRKDVYDILSQTKIKGSFSGVLGRRELLLSMGFDYVKDVDKERYNKEYSLNGNLYYSDNRYIEGQYYSPKSLAKLGADVSIFKGKDIFDFWQYDDYDYYWRLFGEMTFSILGEYRPEFISSSNVQLFVENKDYYLPELAKLNRLLVNCLNFSKALEPKNYYLTPQCGEHKKHLYFHKQFGKILKLEASE
jgi:hypothetical protein